MGVLDRIADRLDHSYLCMPIGAFESLVNRPPIHPFHDEEGRTRFAMNLQNGDDAFVIQPPCNFSFAQERLPVSHMLVCRDSFQSDGTIIREVFGPIDNTEVTLTDLLLDRVAERLEPLHQPRIETPLFGVA